jgi:NADH-quinone oxidoreductase subunit H
MEPWGSAVIRAVFEWLVFPGAAFVAVGGLLAEFLDRKWTARSQHRTGPELLQPLYDLIKLSVKETRGHGPVRLAPFFGLAGALLFSLLVWRSAFLDRTGFRGDFFAAMAALFLAAVVPVFGIPPARHGAASARRINAQLTSWFCFAIAAGVPMLKSGASFRIGDLEPFQQAYGMTMLSPAGALAFFAATAGLFAQLNYAPFGRLKTGIEYISGPAAGYSGPLLLADELTRILLAFSGTGLLVRMFCGPMAFSSPGEASLSILKTAGLFLLMVSLRNGTARLTPTRSLKLFLGPFTLAAFLAVVLSVLGW